MKDNLVVDSSALIAALFHEPERTAALNALFGASQRSMSAFSHLETSLVAMGRRGLAGRTLLDGLLRELDLEIVPFDEDQAEIARDAWERFGKGRHPAALNIGDCCSYALARVKGHPLLYKGNDFSETDLDGIRL